MGKSQPNHRLVKIHRSYTVGEVADLLGHHKNTVRRWIMDGLSTIDGKRPMLILGRVLIEFLQKRRGGKKQPCGPGQLYCVRCHAPKSPAAGMVECQPVTEKIGNLTAICPECNSMMNRRVSMAKLGEFLGKMDITFPQALRQLGEINQPTVNSDLR
ncbi:MAG: helix-turn-helix domain-containing protein [Candidatus Sulfotelmatobacter sp.]